MVEGDETKWLQKTVAQEFPLRTRGFTDTVCTGGLSGLVHLLSPNPQTIYTNQLKPSVNQLNQSSILFTGVAVAPIRVFASCDGATDEL